MQLKITEIMMEREDWDRKETHDDGEEITSRSGITPDSLCAREVEHARLTERLRFEHMARLRASRRVQGQMMFGQGFGPQNPPNMPMPPMFAGSWVERENDYVIPSPFF